jgi:hypothetical protein
VVVVDEGLEHVLEFLECSSRDPAEKSVHNNLVEKLVI